MTRTNMTAIILLTCAIKVGAARAEGIWSWNEDFCASATANVFDGGPVMSQEGCGDVPDSPGFIIAADDDTRPGSLGASAMAFAESYLDAIGDTFYVKVELLAGYFPSFLPGGDNPGGMAEAELFSVIEFEMPTDELQWFYELDIDDMYGPPFTGATHVLIENVTRSETLVETDISLPDVETVLQGSAGDLIRITTQMMGSGSMGPGSGREYDTELRMQFVIPEPQTIHLLSLGTLVALLSRHSRTRHRTL